MTYAAFSSIWLQGLLSRIFGVIRNLQIIIHLPLFNTVLPGNVDSVFQILIPIIQFDLLDSEYTTEKVLEFDTESQLALQPTLRDSIIEMGYETHNSLLNLGSSFLFILFYFMVLILLLFVKIISWKTGYGTNMYIKIKKRLIFGTLISLFMEPFMEIIISAYLNIKAPVSSKNGEIIGIYTGYIAAVCACGVLPLTFLWVITRNQ